MIRSEIVDNNEISPIEVPEGVKRTTVTYVRC